MSRETLTYDKRGSAGWVTLSRPALMNAFNEQMGDDTMRERKSRLAKPEFKGR